MRGNIYVVTHKIVDLELKEPYELLQVGKAFTGINMNCKSDDCGINIANKNNNYCELTGIYWIWKNEQLHDYIGICHYRRFFVKNGKLLDSKQITKIFKRYDVILPKKFYLSDTVWNNYFKNGAGKEKDLINLKNIVCDKYPDYIDAFNSVLNSYSGAYCNMMIMKKNDFDEYCKWLFSILFELEKQTDLTNYSKSEARIFGYLSEILLNVWVLKNGKKIKYQKNKKTDDSFLLRFKIKIKMLINRIKVKLTKTKG